MNKFKMNKDVVGLVFRFVHHIYINEISGEYRKRCRLIYDDQIEYKTKRRWTFKFNYRRQNDKGWWPNGIYNLDNEKVGDICENY